MTDRMTPASYLASRGRTAAFILRFGEPASENLAAEAVSVLAEELSLAGTISVDEALTVTNTFETPDQRAAFAALAARRTS